MAGGYPAIFIDSNITTRLGATRRAATRVALQAGAVSHQSEVGAFGAAFSDIAFHLGFRALVHSAHLRRTGVCASRCEGEVGKGRFADRQRLRDHAQLLLELAFECVGANRLRGSHGGGVATLHDGETIGLGAYETARDLGRDEACRGLALVLALAEIVAEGFWRNMGEIGAAEIGDGEFAEDVIKHGRGALDRVIALHEARRFKAGEGEGFDIFFQRHAVL